MLMIYDCLQQLAILCSEQEAEENPASLFDNDDDVEIEAVQESGDVDNDTDLIPRSEFPSRRSSSHYSVPLTTDLDHDVAMPDADEDRNSNERKAVQADFQNSLCKQFPVCDYQYMMILSSTYSSSQIPDQRQKAFFAEVCTDRKSTRLNSSHI